jgi:hypothetical protein
MAMKKIPLDFTIFNVFVLSLFLLLISACQKDATLNSNSVSNTEISKSLTPANPPFNIEVILRSDGNAFGQIKFRQDNDVTKIISLKPGTGFGTQS